MEERLTAIDNEITRVQKVRRRIEQRQLLLAQAEVRETRTRRRTTRPDYAYMNNPMSDEEDQDEYIDQGDDNDYEERMDEDDGLNFRTLNSSNGRGSAADSGRRRSTRSTRANSDGRSVADEWGSWRGERRSTRLGAPAETQMDVPPPAKRARTEDSAVSSDNGLPTVPPAPGIKLKSNGAAAVKPTETLVEAVAGKKKSKFWVYAVEPIPGAVPALAAAPLEHLPTLESNGTKSVQYHNGTDSMTDDGVEAPSSSEYTNGYGHGKSAADSMSPSSTYMDQS